MYNGNCAIAKKVTGRQVTPYSGKAANFSSSLSTKKCPAQKHTNMAAMDTNNDVKPSKTFVGKSSPKSFASYLEVSIARNMITEVIEKQRATRDEIANTLNAIWFSKTGMPVFSSFPPGTLADVAKATVAMRAATTEQDWDVLVSHALPLLTSSWCDLLNMSFGVSPLLLRRRDDVLENGATPEWALLLIGCLLGLATGLCVAAFNKGVHLIHEWAWAGTPNEGAAWLRLQRLSDTWHRILLIPVAGGVIVGMMHGLVEILEQIRQNLSSHRRGFDLVAGVFPTVKAIQAAVTLGTGCSLGPEGPSVDIGKSCAHGFSLMMANNRERMNTLVAAGAAAGISSGFNAPVAGCFFAIETVLRPLHAENSPPFTTAMILLASVISSTVSNTLLGTQSTFTVPSYDLKSAAELPLYLILGMLCGVVSVAFTRLVTWFTKSFEFIKEKFGLHAVACPALGGLGAGIIALKYPGILYWGFTNVEEILHTGKSASAPGIWLLTQLAAAKVVATALCKGSLLVGGLYAPSLMIGAAVGAVFGGSAAELINSAIPGNAAVAQPQAYALVGMAATLASVCSVPLTSILLLFELTKDYRIILPLMGAVGLAIWVPSVADHGKENEKPGAHSLARGYSSLSNDTDDEAINEDLLAENLKVSKAMSKNYAKVSLSLTLKEAIKYMHDSKQNCLLVVDDEDLLEGILTYGDIRRLSKTSSDASTGDSTIIDVNTCLVSTVCTREIRYRGQVRGLLTCYPDTDLAIAKDLMEAKGIKQLPVVKRSRGSQKDWKRRVVAILHYDSIWNCLREEIARRGRVHQNRKEDRKEDDIEMIENGH